MTNNDWNTNIDQYLAMAPTDKWRWLARLLFSLSVFARGTYEVGGRGITDPIRMRSFNELIHRVAGQQLQYANLSDGRPDMVFCEMLTLALNELGVDIPTIVKMLKEPFHLP